MPAGLTPVMSTVLAFLRSFQASHAGEMPTCDEIAAAIGMKSKSGVFRVLNLLEDRGYVRRGRGARNIELIEHTKYTPTPQQAMRLTALSQSTRRQVNELMSAAMEIGLDVISEDESRNK